MELALIDDDTLYQAIFKDYFELFGIKIDVFSRGEEFLRVPPHIAMKYGFVVIDHTLSDMTGVQLVKMIRPALESEIALVSTYGDALTLPEKKGLEISGDFKKTDLVGICKWYEYFKAPIQEKIAH